MCDVLHAMFEEDYTPHFDQEIEVKGKLRQQLYDVLYNEEYQWKIGTSASEGQPLDTPRTYGRAPRSSGLTAGAVNPETGTIDLPEGTKRADPKKNLPRVQSATPMEDLTEVLGTPLG